VSVVVPRSGNYFEKPTASNFAIHRESEPLTWPRRAVNYSSHKRVLWLHSLSETRWPPSLPCTSNISTIVARAFQVFDYPLARRDHANPPQTFVRSQPMRSWPKGYLSLAETGKSAPSTGKGHPLANKRSSRAESRTLASEQSHGLPNHAYYHAYLLQKRSRKGGTDSYPVQARALHWKSSQQLSNL